MSFKISFIQKIPPSKHLDQYGRSLATDALMSIYSCPTSWSLAHYVPSIEQTVGFTCTSDNPNISAIEVRGWINSLMGVDKCSIVDNLDSTGDITLIIPII